MDRRKFFLGLAAAALAPALPVRDLWAAAAPNDKWFVGFDPAGVDKECTLFFRRTGRGEIWLVDEVDFTTANEIRARWRVAYPEIAKWWGTHGQ